MKGMLISFEGCEGAGKSTQLQLLKQYLTDNKTDFIFAREPGGTEISEKIRNFILDSKNACLTDECEALLYASARAQLLAEVVIPALNQGKLVVLDRYIDSSFAYQAYARGLGFDFVAKINDFALQNAMPNLTVFFDIDPKSAFLRKGGADANDRLEQMGADFHQKVYNGYKQLAKRFPNRFVEVDAHCSAQQIFANILNLLKSRKII